MKQFNIHPEIHKYKRFKDFLKEFKIGDKDLIITHNSTYDKFIKRENVKGHIIVRNNYGSGEPNDEMIDRMILDIPNKEFNRIIAIGGGSVIDIAKLFTIKNVNKAIDLFEKKIPLIKDKELIIVPTTCGTGSEVTNISIAEIKEKETKMGLAIDQLYADYAVLIPELIKELPYKFFIYSSIDALIHAIESYVSPKANPYTKLFSKRAIEIILEGYMEIINKGTDYRLEIIEDFLIASNFAGIAFGNAGVGAVHALSYPLSGKYHVPHGEANYLFFTEVFKKYNDKSPDGSIKEINKIIAKTLNVEEENIYKEFEKILNKLINKSKLRGYGVLEEELETFADSVIEKQQRLLANNYISLSKKDILNIYKNLF
ncbi:MAG: 4-hydroxybutyrate dehydrogenase [Firmicutes bacterium]|nr:4-hydroxybutyrate dehydrogenase [Bacillota bacterium]